MREEVLSWTQPALAPAPAAVRTECPERPARGWSHDFTQQLRRRRGQTRRPRERILEKEGQEGGLGAPTLSEFIPHPIYLPSRFSGGLRKPWALTLLISRL